MLETTERGKKPRRNGIMEFYIGFKDEKIKDSNKISSIIDKTIKFTEEPSDVWDIPIEVVDLSENCGYLSFKIKLIIQLTDLNRKNMLESGADSYMNVIVEDYIKLYNRIS